ncbi:MAG: hypothetical protein M3P27_00470 [Acidobacteriota bacterium]|nr:hypothetical protein [Acidobacteriota bacterium]
MALFAEWESYYVIMGSSAAALIGLQFVVIALIADLRSHSTSREIDAFATPTIVHFGTVLLLSGIVSAPWHRLALPAVLFGTGGALGLVYTLIILRRARRQTGYAPVFEDWMFHVILPALAYAALATAAALLSRRTEQALFGIGAAALLLLFVGIHNAWDTVTYIVTVRRVQEPDNDQKSSQRE